MKRSVVMPNYSVGEGLCECGCGEGLKDDLVLALQAYINILSRIYNASVRHIMTSGARCKKHNAATPNASPTSKHIGGGAADGYFEYLHNKQWVRIDSVDAAIVAVKSGLFGGVGYRQYIKEGTKIIHLDVRTGPCVTW